MKQFLLISFLSISTLSFTQLESFESKIYKEERTISVFLPESYYSMDSSKRYHVAYLFDSQFEPYFSIVSSIMSYYEQTNEGIPLIVVGIHTKKRWGEFVPICKGEETNNPEGADKLSFFLKDEVMPLIEANYRTTNFKIGIGHSLGGTYVLNEIIKEKSLFNAVIAVSPNLTVCNEQIIHNSQEFFINNIENRRFIYTTAGTVGDMEINFKQSLLRLDSLCSIMVLKNMFWKCDILKAHNHMTTFVPSFNTGYLELSEKLILMDSEILKMLEDSTLTIVAQITAFYNELSSFSQEEHQLNINKVMSHAKTLAQYGEFRACIELCQYANKMLESEEISQSEKTEISEMIEARQVRAEFNAIANEANVFAMKGDYINAGNLYIKAFDMNLIRATHLVRMKAIPVFAQSGKIQEAFEQLDLLANKFELGNNYQFINDPLCSPLHKDKRWVKFMDKLAENGELYR